MSDNTPLTSWGPGQAEALGRELVLAEHRLAELPLFGDAAVADLLDHHPRTELQAYTMGTDAGAAWMPVDVGPATGAELLEVVARGQLWLNVLRIDRSDAAFSDLQDRLFGEIEARNPDFEGGSARSTVLVSSPGTQVPFHVDAGPNVFWHVRGEKRVFVYPALDEHFVARRTLEDIYCSAHEEYVPYSPEFDESARVFDLAAGEVLAWPQNSPHRVVNVAGVNVSLSCEYATGASRRREYLWCGNRFVSRTLRLPARSTRETGAAAAIKRFAFRAARKARLTRPGAQHVYLAAVRVDPEAPDGLVRVDEPVRAPFSTG